MWKQQKRKEENNMILGNQKHKCTLNSKDNNE